MAKKRKSSKRSKQKRSGLSSAFLRQLFFFCLLIGGILPMEIVSNIVLESFPINLDKFEKAFKENSTAAKDALEGFKDVQVDMPDFMEGVDGGQLETLDVSKFEGELENIYNDHKETLEKGEESIGLIISFLQKLTSIFKKIGDFLIHGIPLNETLNYILFGIFFLFVLLSIGWLISNRKIKLIALLLPSVFILIVVLADYFFPKGGINGTIATILLVLSGILTVLGLIYFIRRGHVRSKAMLFLFIVTTLFLGLPFAVFYLFTVLVFRLLYLFVAQNLAIFRTLKSGRLILIFLKSVIYWLPLLLFVIPGNYLSNKIYNTSIDTIYENIFRDKGITRTEESDFQNDLDKYVNELFKPIEGEDFDKKLDNITGNIDMTSDNVPFAITKAYFKETNQILNEQIAPQLKHEECGFYLFVSACCIRNEIRSFAWQKCNEWNMKLGLHILKTTIKASQEGKDLSQAINDSRLAIKESVRKLKESVRFSIDAIYGSIVLLKFIMDFLLLLLIIKSFMVVFSRVAFSGKDDVYVTLLEEEKRMTKGTIKKCGKQYTILSSVKSNFYASRKYKPSGRPPKFSIPQKFKVIFSRILTGNYALNHIVMKGRKGSVYFNLTGSNEFVEWELKPNEQVIFHMRNFIAMSDSVKLSTTYSFRMTSLLLGTMRFTTASGPGKLILLSKGKPVTSGERKGNASVPVERIIAWQKNTRFHVHSEVNITDVFMSGIYLQKKPGDPIIIDADERGKAANGISRFIKSFLIPI